MITTSRPSEWDELLPSPGGTVRSLATAAISAERREVALNAYGRTATIIVDCPDCGGKMYATFTGYPHAVRWDPQSKTPRKIDCVGREVSPAESASGASTGCP